jgi:hypothetical protein
VPFSWPIQGAPSQGYAAIVPGTLVTTIGGEQPFERGEISSLGGVDERVEESLGWAALTCLRRSPARWRRRAGGELPGVCLADREHFGDLPVGVVERFAEHVGGSFDGRPVLEEHEHRAVERFGALRAVREVGLDVDRLGEPRADVGLASCSGRLGDVDRESSRGGG